MLKRNGKLGGYLLFLTASNAFLLYLGRLSESFMLFAKNKSMRARCSCTHSNSHDPVMVDRLVAFG
jgi:hypothetical protein